MTILVVDDNTDYLKLMRDALFASGYTVHTAEDGEEGCALLSKYDIDLIISDIRMPRLDGLKMHAFARELERYKHTVFVFISGFKNVYRDLLQLNDKTDFFFDKTTPIDEIVSFVDNLMFGGFSTLWRPEDNKA
jgi:DNA-binding response OmpR family regulator